jgi:hypothetical protein
MCMDLYQLEGMAFRSFVTEILSEFALQLIVP